MQTQINPHFLFNTLYMISSTIIVNNDQDTDAVNMISKLSDILRYSLKTEEYIVTLDEELKILQSYISILSTRHGDTFDVEWYVTDDMLYISVTDNGAGISPEKIKELTSFSARTIFSETHISG